jgi:hypothetical protein
VIQIASRKILSARPKTIKNIKQNNFIDLEEYPLILKSESSGEM